MNKPYWVWLILSRIIMLKLIKKPIITDCYDCSKKSFFFTLKKFLMSVPKLTHLAGVALEENGVDVKECVIKNNLPDTLIPSHPIFSMVYLSDDTTDDFNVTVCYTGQYHINVSHSFPAGHRKYSIKTKSEDVVLVFLHDCIDRYSFFEFEVTHGDHYTNYLPILNFFDDDNKKELQKSKVKQYIHFIKESFIDDVDVHFLPHDDKDHNDVSDNDDA
jgi:hypothetical protein